MSGADETPAPADYDECYALGDAPVLREIERHACGCDYGATSWTTEAEARALADALDLRPGARLLDVGSGTGWPALYLSRLRGVRATLTDVSREGLRRAETRAAAEGAEEVRLVESAGEALPFAEASFDAITHSDVLCCLEDKGGVLAECRRVLAPVGRMVFTVLHLAPGATASDTARAAAAGPALIGAPAPYPELVRQAGFVLERETDLTPAFADTIARMTEAWEARLDRLAEVYDDAERDELLEKLHAKSALVAEGVVRRSAYLASRPS